MKWFLRLRPIPKILMGLLVILVVGFLLPQHLSMPVEGATRASYDQHSYWAYPWGESVTHKGVDIFARTGTNVHPATAGLVVYAGQNRLGGNVVFVLGPKWRVHYYAHLQEIKTRTFAVVGKGAVLGTVGATGNAKGKPSHLHYHIRTYIPYFWHTDKSIQGWQKAYFVNPIPYLNQSFEHA
ncbi:MAG: M23 family metallopeptidase [Bacteroidetes bacterium]|nr:M23 family metallopeptidase [Bacteroidota bacterium]